MKNEKYPDVDNLVPHKPPMILIDRVLACNLENLSLKAEFRVTEESMFYDELHAGVPAWVGLEYMAQAIAALYGLQGRERGLEKPKIGFILGARSYQNKVDYYKKGTDYSVEIESLFYDEALASVLCMIREQEGGICATAEINVFSPEDPLRFLQEGKRDG